MKTFVVRVWAPERDEVTVKLGLHGVLEHVGSREVEPFQSEAELVELLRAALAGDARVTSRRAVRDA